jgi:hypothetical protein
MTYRGWIVGPAETLPGLLETLGIDWDCFTPYSDNPPGVTPLVEFETPMVSELQMQGLDPHWGELIWTLLPNNAPYIGRWSSKPPELT